MAALPMFTVSMSDATGNFFQYVVNDAADANAALQKAFNQFLLDAPGSAEISQISISPFNGKVI